MSTVLEKFITNLFESELGLGKQIAPYIPPSVVPFAPAVPSPFDMDTKRRKTFPIFNRRRGVTDTVEPTIIEEDDGGDDPPPTITIETIEGNLSSYINKSNVNKSFIDQKLGLETSKELASGQERVTGMGGALKNVASLAGFSTTMLDAISEKSKQNLENIVANAALGIEGYGIGRVNNQTVGVGPGLFGGTTLSGTLPTGLTTQQRSEIINALEGKSGALGSAKSEYSELGGRFNMSKGQSRAMLDYEQTVINSKGLSKSQKMGLLGYDRLTNPFEVSRMPQNYYTITPFEQILQDKKETERNREGMTSQSGPMSLGLETDLAAQDNQITPTAINIGIDMDNISGVPTGVGATGNLGGGFGGPTGGVSGLDASSGFSDDSGGGYSDNEAGDNQSDSGFGGGGWTAYGGKIGMFGGGFASKVAKIKGVGLIEPDKTFLDTDVVRDRFEFNAENGDYIVNGPASDTNNVEIKFLVKNAIDELQKEGVDIRIGNPKIKSKDKVPLVVASSETYIPRVIAEKIGYSVLDGINNSGKAEVTRLKNKLDNQPTDKSKYAASEGMLVKKPEQGFLFRKPDLNVTGPNIDRFEERFVPGISDNPPAMTLNEQTFFDDYEFGDIKKAIRKTEIQGFEEYPYIFTGVRAKKGKSSSAFGPMQITKALIEDFEKRSPDYKTLSKEEKNYLNLLKIQGEDKINQELYGTVFRGPEELRKKVNARKIYGKKAKGLKPYGRGTIDPKLHEKYYDKIADVILLHKLDDHDNIEDFLASYGEGADYASKVLNDLRDIMQGVEPPTAVKSQ